MNEPFGKGIERGEQQGYRAEKHGQPIEKRDEGKSHSEERDQYTYSVKLRQLSGSQRACLRAGNLPVEPAVGEIVQDDAGTPHQEGPGRKNQNEMPGGNAS